LPAEKSRFWQLKLSENIAQRLQLLPEDEAEVRFPSSSSTWKCLPRCQAPDVFDPVTVRSFAAVVETRERLQRLCLLTYADIHAVNPEALTPWRAEMLWQLYLATSNLLTHSLDPTVCMPCRRTSLVQLRRVNRMRRVGKIERSRGFPRR